MASPSADAVKEQIARELIRVHEDSYGEITCNVDIALHDNFIAVIMDLELSHAEVVLIESGNAPSVREGREAFQKAVADTFSEVVERATGRRVVSFAGRAMIEDDPPWAIEFFRLNCHKAAP